MNKIIVVAAILFAVISAMGASCRPVGGTETPAAPPAPPAAPVTAAGNQGFFDPRPASPPPAGIGGWQKPRALSEDQKARVAAIAAGSPEASSWLQGRTDYRTSPVHWYAIVWKESGAGTWWKQEYEIVAGETPTFGGAEVLWYPGVAIYAGERTITLMQVAVDLDSGKAAMADGPLPSLDSPDRFGGLDR